MNTTQDTSAPVAASKAIVIGKFPGAFGNFQSSAFYDLKAAGLKEVICHKVAFDYGSDLGNAIRNAKDDGLSSKVAKAKTNGDARISISGGGVTKTSRAMSLIRLAQQLDGLYKEKLVKSRHIDEENLTTGEGSLSEYLQECDEWATAQNWAE